MSLMTVALGYPSHHAYCPSHYRSSLSAKARHHWHCPKSHQRYPVAYAVLCQSRQAPSSKRPICKLAFVPRWHKRPGNYREDYGQIADNKKGALWCDLSHGSGFRAIPRPHYIAPFSSRATMTAPISHNLQTQSSGKL